MNKSRPVVKKSWRTESLFIQTFMTFPHDSAALVLTLAPAVLLISPVVSAVAPLQPLFRFFIERFNPSSRANDHPALSNDRDTVLVNARKLLIFVVTMVGKE